MKPIKRALLISIASGLISGGTLCINASKVNGEIPYSSITVTFLVELFKFCFCMVLMFTHGYPQYKSDYMDQPIIEEHDRNEGGVDLLKEYMRYLVSLLSLRKSIILFSAPAILYLLDNNLTYVILLYLDPPTLSILWNFKIVITAILCRIVFKRHLHQVQWCAIILLMLGIITTQSNHPHGVQNSSSAAVAQETNTNEDSNLNATLHSTGTSNPSQGVGDLIIGILWVFVGVTTSSMASVYTEWALKKYVMEFFFLQNAQLYLYGVLFNGIAVIYHLYSSSDDFFQGYNKWTVVNIVIQSVAGITVGLILKFLDNIDALLAHVLAMLISMLFSIFQFGFTVTLTFFCGFSVCLTALYLYHIDFTLVISPMKNSTNRSRSTKGTSERNEKQSKGYGRITQLSTDGVEMETEDDRDEVEVEIDVIPVNRKITGYGRIQHTSADPDEPDIQLGDESSNSIELPQLPDKVLVKGYGKIQQSEAE